MYLTVEDVLGFYADLFGCTEQEAADQLRNLGHLAAALNRPRTYAYYRGADIALQAAVLAHGITESQPFIEGNKRAALLALHAFLALNGFALTATQDDLFNWMLWLSQGMSADELAERLRIALAPAP